jgi:hypothetical protein
MRYLQWFMVACGGLVLSVATAAPVELYNGSTVPTAQGWIRPHAEGTETLGVGTTVFATTTAPAARTSETNWYAYTTSSAHFIASIRLRTFSVDPHNALDAGLMFAVTDTFTPPSGSMTNRSNMLYIDTAAVGWSDNSGAHPVDTTEFHEYMIHYHNGTMDVYIDETFASVAAGLAVPILSKSFATTNTTSAMIVFGDQTNDAGVDSNYEVDYVKFQDLNPAPPSAAAATSIPSVSAWGLGGLAAMLGVWGMAATRRRA